MPLFGTGPDHVITKWWKLWAVFKLSISIERLEAGNRQYIHALRHKGTEIPELQQWWVGCFYSEKIRGGERGICFGFFFNFLSHSQQTGSKSEGGAAVISTVVLCCDVEDLKQLSILHEECTQDAIFIKFYSLDQRSEWLHLDVRVFCACIHTA